MLHSSSPPSAAAGSASISSPPPGSPGGAAGRARALAALRGARAVCFDVDSTVITVEAIDELAAFAGAREAVAALTAAAMGGGMDFRSALSARLALIRPSASLLASFLAAHAFEWTPGVRELVAALRRRGADVFLVSGGFTQMIHPLADALGLPRAHVHANTLLFGPAGEYAGFDQAAPTSRDGGKPEVLRRLRAQLGPGPIVMVGDGATDMQARPPADAFVGYGGVVVRPAVRDGACLFTTDFADLLRRIEDDKAM
jgi:phosphoserine phosphatase